MIAFMRVGQPRIARDPIGGNPRIWVVEDDGSNARAITDGAYADTDPQLSPDGANVVFVRHDKSSRDHGLFLGEIFVVPVAGGEPVRITHLVGVKIRPSWSPDGKVILFESTMNDSNYNLYSVPLEGAPVTKLTYGSPSKEFPAFSPDGSLIAFVTPVISDLGGRSGIGHAIWTMPSEGGEPRQLSDGLGASDREPAWSPDGRCIAFARSLKGEWIAVSERSRSGLSALHSMDADGSNVKRLTGSTASYSHPSWSPDGLRLVAARSDGRGAHPIVVMSNRGESERILTEPAPLQDYDPSWS